MEDHHQSSNKILAETIKSGLNAIGDEEQFLLQIRPQLHKMKKIREDQAKKDLLICELEERNSILEYERNVSLRQNADLHQIMIDRIETLEKHLQEKDSLEKIYVQKIDTLQHLEYERKVLHEELELLKIRYEFIGFPKFRNA